MIPRHNTRGVTPAWGALLALGSIVGLVPTGASAQPIAPNYSAAYFDAVTGDNAFVATDGKRYWTIDSLADAYAADVYERPTAKSFISVEGLFATDEYHGYLDIDQARAGFDTRYLYVAIRLFNRWHSKSDGSDTVKGLVERYGFRIGADRDGRGGHLLFADQPELKNSPNTAWGTVGAYGHRDSDGDAGGAATGAPGKGEAGPTGRTITKSDNPQEERGLNGYETVVISDGKNSSGAHVLFVRIAPHDPNTVEFALDYGALGYSHAQISILPYLEIEAIKGGPKDPQNYPWNDKYTLGEAGSPNPGEGGLGNVYEVDTLRTPGIQSDIMEQ